MFASFLLLSLLLLVTGLNGYQSLKACQRLQKPHFAKLGHFFEYLKKPLIISNLFFFSTWNFADLPHINHPPQAIADSTGKFSTKLTSRRRYLPVIIQERQNFLSLQGNDALNTWIKEDFPKLKKSMVLYGVSLRAGEYPDAISKKAGELTSNFANEVDTLDKLLRSSQASSKESINSQLNACYEALNNYIQFAKIDKEINPN